MGLTNPGKCGKIRPRLSLGVDRILKYPYTKGSRSYTKKVVRVCDGIVTVLDPGTKDQTVVGLALEIDGILILALPVHRES